MTPETYLALRALLPRPRFAEWSNALANLEGWELQAHRDWSIFWMHGRRFASPRDVVCHVWKRACAGSDYHVTALLLHSKPGWVLEYVTGGHND